MRYKSKQRRRRGAVASLVGLLVLAVAVTALWVFVLRENAPFAIRVDRSVMLTPTPAPEDGAAAEQSDAEQSDSEETPGASDGESIVTATPERLPSPTPEITPTPEPADETAAAPEDGEDVSAPSAVAKAAAPGDEATAEPTDAPTDEPTNAPTVEPTNAPTVEPTAEPTINPEAFDEADTLERGTASTIVTGDVPQGAQMVRVRTTDSDGHLNLREKPASDGKILMEIPNGTMLRWIDEETEGWAHVEREGTVGYVASQYLIKLTSAEALELPYYIEVDRGMQVVRVYTIAEDGTYSLLAREMICSTDTFDRKPPNATYALDGEKLRWLVTLTPDSYAQYATRITGHILFHSLTYSAMKPDQLNAESYNLLGTNASIGCVRLLCADAKWIYDNVPVGTPVRYMTSERSEEKLSELAPPPLGSGHWDPTDPSENNPDYTPAYEVNHPAATPVPGVTPAPTEPWTPATY